MADIRLCRSTIRLDSATRCNLSRKLRLSSEPCTQTRLQRRRRQRLPRTATSDQCRTRKRSYHRVALNNILGSGTKPKKGQVIQCPREFVSTSRTPTLAASLSRRLAARSTRDAARAQATACSLTLWLTPGRVPRKRLALQNWEPVLRQAEAPSQSDPC